MNFARFRAFHVRRAGRSTSSSQTSSHALDAGRLDPDLPFDMLSALLNHFGASAAVVVAWMRHEDVHTLEQHPLDVAATMFWAGGFYLLSLCVRALSRVFRQRRALRQVEASPVD